MAAVFIDPRSLALGADSPPHVEQRGESLEDLITCPVTYRAWFCAWF